MEYYLFTFYWVDKVGRRLYLRKVIFWIFIVFFLLYGLIPGIFSAGFGLGVFRKGTSAQKVAFTFDDGPDPMYTPKLLDLLRKFDIKATFFVLGSKAEKNPELIRRMYQEGHLIGIHNYTHQTNWLMTPWTIRRELNRSAVIIEQLTSVRPNYYRPPWGLLNLFDFFLHKQYRIILWSLMVGDWRSEGGSEKIIRKLLHKIKDGSIVLLHDSGDTLGANQDAPFYMIQALEVVFHEICHRGYTCVRIDQMMELE
ncbi:polysaccharide deacetylase family protein [Pseudogracilibacillus auburnensis]|nr:polysaccharide deacetylase family protein [Pseudogracilibacillus auburnensis]